MKQDKPFDCVQMKWEIQERHRREASELGEEEAAKRRWQRVLDDPVLGAFVRTHRARGSRPYREELAL
jgi:hypothetical protein